MKKFILLVVLLCIGLVGMSAAQTTTDPAPTTTTVATNDDSKASEKKAADLKKEDPVTPSTARRKVIPPPEKANPVRIPKIDKAPVIDGKLDDEVWKNAVVLKDFYQRSPGDNIEPSKPTEVMIAYDPKFLYFAFKCYDEPDKVRATVAKRDNVFGEDNVRIYLDTFNDQRKSYVFIFNPLGVQQDGILTEGGAENYSVDIVMESKGKVVKDGYIVEVAIPFKSLR